MAQIILKSFEYLEPGTLKEAAQLSKKYGGKAKVFAGGLDLVPRMRQGKVEPDYIISIRNIPGLDRIENGKGLRIGALASLFSVELHPALQKSYMVLYDAIHHIASVPVKVMGTLVGNLCVATPASDVAPALFVLGAQLKIVGPSGEKTVPVESFFVGVNQHILKPGEIVTEVLVPSPPAGTGGAFFKLVRTAVDIAKVNVAVAVTVTGKTCDDARIALGSVAPTPIRATKAEGILKGQKLDQKTIEAAAEAAAEEIRPITDIRSTAEYRKITTQVLVRRAIQESLARIKA